MEIVYRPEKIDRRSVSIPKSLLEEMRKHTNVNWSAVACRAFEQVVLQLSKESESIGQA